MLEQAREFYHRIGSRFAQLLVSKDLPQGDVAKGVKRVFSRALTSVSALDVVRVSHVIERGGGVVTHAEASAAIASGAVGRSKLSALHVRRVVRIDLSKGLRTDSPVSLMGDGGTIL